MLCLVPDGIRSAAPASAQSAAGIRHIGPAVAAVESSADAEELEPVAVPEASELAMQFYRSGNWLWMLNVLWGVLLPGGAGVLQDSRRGCETWRRSWAESGSSRSVFTWSCIWRSSS